MADVNANINIDINTSNALAQLKALQREISRFHSSVAKSSEAAGLAQRDLQRNFINGVNSIKGFSAELRTVKTTAENFTDSLERNKFSMREYFRYSAASTKTFGRVFRSELDTVNKVAEENVKRLQTQYIKMGRDANGAMRAIAVMPTKLDMSSFTTQAQLAAQKQAIFNQLVKQGSTNLLNFGKNTQWAGRQLMVGFTLPLMALGSAASKTFMDMETAAIKFRKVYGDLFTPVEEREKAFQDMEELGRKFTKYGISVAQTINLAADAAAAGFAGLDLERQVTEATRLQVLGQIDQQKALETTISLQNAFELQSKDLAESINFLNAVENQTVVALEDITTAIPKAAPTVRELGGDVRDLAFFMAAMKEGGINAAQGANALKSGLASLINPSDKAKEKLNSFGIDIDSIVNKNAGNLKNTVIEFAKELDNLSDLDRQRAIEQLFGKFQLARLSTLFTNVIKEGNQASRVLDLAGASTEELAALAEGELGITANSAMNKFRASVENLKASLAPIGEIFLEIITPFLENIKDLFDRFNNLSSGTKKIIAGLVIGIGAIAPVVLMTIGLFANFVANGIKGLMLLRTGYLRLTGQSQILSEQTNYLSVEQQQALAAAASLEQSHIRLQQVFTGEAAAIRSLITEYQKMIAAQNLAAVRMPGMMAPGFKPTGYAKGVVSVPGPKGAGDIIPAMLSPGEAVVPAKQNKKYAPLVQGIIADNIPGFEGGVTSVAERFISTRVGRSASGGERSQVNIPGGYQLGHFAEPIKVSGEELRRLAESQSQAFKNAVEAMIASVDGDISRVFDVFTNEVTTQSKELNQALGEFGSGRLASTEMFRKEAVSQAGGYNAPLVREMKKAGASPEEVDIAVTRLSQEVQKGIDNLGGEITITAEEVSKITQDAYDIVSAENEKVSAAREKLKSPGALKEMSGVTAGRVPFAGGYNTQQSKKEINAVVQEQIPGVYPTQQAFNFMGPAARKVGIQNAIAINQIYDQLGAEAKSRVLDLLGDIDAMSQQVVLEAKNAGIDIGAYAIQGIAEGTASQSPSQKAKQQGQNVVDGFEQGILEGMDDAALAAEKVNNAAMQELGQPMIPGLAVGNIYEQFRGTAPGASATTSIDNLTDSVDNLDSVTIQAAQTTSQSSNKLGKLNDRMMGMSFAISGITGLASAFGNNLGGVGDKLFKVSSAMFALQGVVQALTSAKLLELAATRIQIARGAAATAAELGMGRGSQIAMFSRALFTAINPLAKIALVVGAGIAIYKIINNRIEENRKKIDGLGDSALIAGKKLEALEKFFGTDFRRFTFESFKFDEATAGPALVSGRRQQAEALMADEEFRKQYKDTVDALRSATNSEAQLVLEGISMQLQARGATAEQIQTVTDSLIKMAGKTEITLDFAKIDIKSKEGKQALKKNVNEILKGYNKAFTKGINDSYKRTLNLAGKSIAAVFGSLQLQLEDGSISAKEYADQINNINAQILSMPDSQAKLNLVNAVFDSMGEEAAKAAAGVTNLNNKLLLAQAILLGVADSQTIKNLSSPLFFIQDIAARTLSINIEKAFSQLSSGLKDLDKTTKTGNGSTGKGLTLQERLIKIYQKQAKALEEKLKLMQDVNDEIERNNEFTKQQVDLDRQITEAKMSGNYLEAAALLQQKTMEAAQFARETEEIDIQKQIDNINKRISQLEDKGAITSAEKRLLGLEDKKKGPAKPATKTDKAKTDKAKTDKDNAGATITGTIQNTKPTAKSPDEARSGYTTGQPKRQIPKPTAEESRNPGVGILVFDTVAGKWKWKTAKSPTDIIFHDYNTGKKTTYAGGGLIKGPGTGTSDSILGMANGGMPIRVSNGEFIFSKKAVDNAGGPNAVDAMHQYFRSTPGFKNGGAPHEMGMRGQVPAKKLNWFQNYVKNLTESQDNVPFFGKRGMADPFGVGQLLRRMAGQSREGDSPYLAAALLPLNFMGLGVGPRIAGSIASGAARPLSVAEGLSASQGFAKSLFKTKYVESGDRAFPIHVLKDGTRVGLQGKQENYSELLKAGLIDEIISTTPEGILTAGLKSNPGNKQASDLLNSIKNKTYLTNETERSAYNDFLDSMIASTSINSKGEASFMNDTSGLMILLESLKGNKTATDIIGAKKSALYNIMKAKEAKRTQENLDFYGFAKKMGTLSPGTGDPSKVAVIHSRSSEFPFKIDSNGNVVAYSRGEISAGTDQAVARSTFHTSLDDVVTGIMERGEDPLNIKLVTRLDSAIKNNGIPYSMYEQDTFWSLNPGQPFIAKKGEYSIIRPIENLTKYKKELLKRGLIKDGEEIPSISFDPRTSEVLYSADSEWHVADKAAAIAKDKIGIANYAADSSVPYVDAATRKANIENIGYDLGVSNPLHANTGPAMAEDKFNSLSGPWHYKGPFMFTSNMLETDTIQAAREQARHGFFASNLMDLEEAKRVAKWKKRGYTFSSGGYINMASLPKFKNGIDRVPYDMPAILHKNERVLTAEENKNYGNSNLTISPTFNITGGNSKEIVDQVMVKLNTLANKNNKSNKVII
jgi:TP901 family phage tail tape measure protein